MKKLTFLLLLFFASCSSSNDDETSVDNTSYTIWKGSNVTFTKTEGSDPNEANNQDRITSNVWITRGNNGGQIYNIVKENSSTKTSSPAGTKWARGTIDQLSSLTFTSFTTAVVKSTDILGKNFVMYLEEDKIYLSVKFTAWSSGAGNGQGGGGGFAYQRSTK